MPITVGLVHSRNKGAITLPLIPQIEGVEECKEWGVLAMGRLTVKFQKSMEKILRISLQQVVKEIHLIRRIQTTNKIKDKKTLHWYKRITLSP